MRKNSSSDEFIDSQSNSETNSESLSLTDTDSSSVTSSDEQDIKPKKSSLSNKSNSQRKYPSSISHYSNRYQGFNSESELESDLEYSSESVAISSSRTTEIGKIIGTNQPSFLANSPDVKFYVKFKNLSYIHCQWITKSQLCRTHRGEQIFKFFMKHPMPFRQVTFFSQITHYESEDEQQLFKPSKIEYDIGYIIPEKVISMRINDDDEEEFLIKWVSLDYDESSWETDIPSNYIEEYRQRNSFTHSPIYDEKENEGKRTFEQFTESPQYKNDHFLTDYQVDGLNWLQFCWFQKRNSILADEMGLGKTIESISILDALSKWYTSWGPFLIVCPLTTISNWIDEFRGWTDFRVVCLMGNPESRKVIKENVIYHHVDDTDLIDKSEIIFDVLIVSYEWLSRELSFIKKFKFMYTIIDEAQKIKNEKSAIYKNCMAIQSYHKLLMTGTPIQNNMFEIWSLLHYISPTVFMSYKDFSDAFGCKDDPREIERLQEVLKPYIFRRKKNDVNLELPEKEETIIEVEMTHMQRTISQFIIKDNVDILSDLSAYKCNLRNVMMELRKLFCHPFLMPNLESLCISEYKDAHQIPQDDPLTEDDEYDALINASGKTILIDKLLPKLKEGNHKVLIFSQMTKMLDIIEDYLVYRHYTYERIDGNCSNARRAMAIERFQNDDEIFVFLLSTRAGGLGINLTCADTVIIYDCDWNPQNDIQAQSRCHRIGQSKKVNVYRLITRGCYESEMFLRASKKLALDFAILDSDPSLVNLVNEENNDEESKVDSRLALQMILRNGAYYTFNDDPNEIDKFCSENIDQILEHRSHTRKNIVSGGKSRFSKVSFDVASSIDDEVGKMNFWDNLIKSSKATKSDIGGDDDDEVNENGGKIANLRNKTRKKITQTYNYDEDTDKRKKKKKKKKSSDDDISISNDDDYSSSNNNNNNDDDDDDDSGSSNSSSSTYSSYSSYSYSNSDNEFVLSEKSEQEEEEDDNFEMIPDDDDLSNTKKPSYRSTKSVAPSPLIANQLNVRPSSVSAPPNQSQPMTELAYQLSKFINSTLPNNQKGAKLIIHPVMYPNGAIQQNYIYNQQMQINPNLPNNYAYNPNIQVNQNQPSNYAYNPNIQINPNLPNNYAYNTNIQVNQNLPNNYAYNPNNQVNQNVLVYPSNQLPKPNANTSAGATKGTRANPKSSPQLNIVSQSTQPNPNPSQNQAPKSNSKDAVLLKNKEPNSSPQLVIENQQKQPDKEAEHHEVVEVFDSSDYSAVDSPISAPPIEANPTSTPPKTNAFEESDSYSDVDLSSSFSPSSSSVSSPTSSSKQSTKTLSSSELFELCEKIIKIIKKHGFELSRFHIDQFEREIAKSLICIAFNRLTESDKDKYESYINESVLNTGEITKSQYAEFQDEKFITSLFKGDELNIISCCMKNDISFKNALFVSNEIFPKNYQFAPEMPTPSGWSTINDFIALTSSLFVENIDDLINDDKLPFKLFSLIYPSTFKSWLPVRIKLISYELSRFIPLNYNIHGKYDNSMVQKKLQDVEKFECLNQHVIHPSILNINIQKKILRILYLYGFPKKDGVPKIKKMIKYDFIDDKLILIFVAKVLIKGMAYENGLCEILENSSSFDEVSLLNNDKSVNINWIKEEAIQAVSSNLYLFYRIRENHKWFIKNFDSLCIPEWTEIKEKFDWWNIEYDKILLEITGSYGFLFNYFLCINFPQCQSCADKIKNWKTEELKSLTPIVHQDFKFLEPICNLETKKKRVNQIMNIIQEARLKEKE